MLEEDFVRDLRKLAHETGLEGDSFESGHARWRVYSAALRIPGRADQLISALGHEPDEAIAVSVALKCIEELPEPLREMVASTLPVGNSQEFVRARMADLSVLDALVSRPGDQVEPASMERWSPWLQLRAATSSSRQQVLEYLASSGRTKRIRRTALARSKELSS
ncbi:hypothetical protein [Amycolatopsis sp. La24]|uniref:hypothetical protein n=1 Tax=Amycolatopsis sp. La24 TaxID=3028304 RepID=UPI0023AE74EC|nr:hypothetical protein [Amycolatopsis sp. La24]